VQYESERETAELVKKRETERARGIEREGVRDRVREREY